MSDTPALSMLDLTLEEFEDLYFINEGIFRSVNNWFYFANDKKPSPVASKGYVRYGRNRGRRKALGFPEDAYGGLVLLCRTDADIEMLRAKCAEEKNNIVRFELKDGTKAHYGIIKDSIGVWGELDLEYPLLVIPNNPQMKEWPYSLCGSTTFDAASQEPGTLPYDVANGKIEKLIPDCIKYDLAILKRDRL